MLHLAQAMVHSLIWKSLDVFRVVGVQRWSMASDLCRDSVMPHPTRWCITRWCPTPLARSLSSYSAACLLHFSLLCRGVYQLVGLPSIHPFLLSPLEGLRGQIPSCSLTVLKIWIDDLCNRFILWILSFYFCCTIQFCWTSNWRFHNILLTWDIFVVIFTFYQ